MATWLDEKTSVLFSVNQYSSDVTHSFHSKYTIKDGLKWQITQFLRICSNEDFYKAYGIIFQALRKNNYSKRWRWGRANRVEFGFKSCGLGSGCCLVGWVVYGLVEKYGFYSKIYAKSPPVIQLTQYKYHTLPYKYHPLLPPH